MIVVGIDPSLTSTGIALVDTDDRLAIPTHMVGGKGRAAASWDERYQRIRDLADRVVLTTNPFAVDLYVVEAPSYGQGRQGGQHDRAGLWWELYGRLRDYAPILVVPPSVRAKYATGKGNASKEAVMLAAAKRYPQADITGNDSADAVILAAIGARTLGRPVEDSLPKTHLDALGKVSLRGGAT